MEEDLKRANAQAQPEEPTASEADTTSSTEPSQSTSEEAQPIVAASTETYELIAKTFQGLEQVLAKELTELGADNIKIGRRMVSFTGTKEMMYRANFALRTAVRVLKPIKHFKAQTADQVYDTIKTVEWEKYLNVQTSFAVDSVVFSEDFRHSKFVAYKVKDAIVDYFREKTGERPNICVTNPDLRLNIHIADNDCTLSLDSSGESLHMRGYRQESVEAPLNEALAAGLILLTGWHGECDFIDPMCGSGTLPIEAALIARNIAPGVFRKEYAFEKWADFDKDLLDRIYNDDSSEREFEHKIYGYDNSPQAINIAQTNVKAAGVSKDVEIKLQAFQQFMQPAERSILVTNPPYGERISAPDILGLYRAIGERLKHQFVDSDAWIISHREELFDEIGLKPSLKIPLYNGSLECEFRKYQIFSGRYNDMRSEGGKIKTDDELRQMSEKHRFKEHREDFKRRSTDADADESAPFHYRSHDDDDRGGRRSFHRDEERRPTRRYSRDSDDDRRPRSRSTDDDRRPRSRDRDGDRPRRPFNSDRDHRSFGPSRRPSDHKPPFGGHKPFNRNNNSFGDDQEDD
jgi:putative N6-adenine-specific DNA methylase